MPTTFIMSFDHLSNRDAPRSSSGVNYNLVSDRVIEPSRFEREKEYKQKEKSKSMTGTKPVVSSAFDAFRRLATGMDGRSIADKISDSSRPTWEQYKKDNEDKLDITGTEQKRMQQYRKELDENRERLLHKSTSGSRTAAISDSEDESDSSRSDHRSRSRDRESRRHKKGSHDKRHKDHKDHRSHRSHKHHKDKRDRSRSRERKRHSHGSHKGDKHS